MANKLGSENLALDTPTGSQPIAHGVDVRSNFLFNSQIWGIEEADAILIVGSNPRHEAAVLNARIRKQWLRSDLEIVRALWYRPRCSQVRSLWPLRRDP
ncbi:hypothetical protein LB505_007078 [Fusarium chuoi]|nr:hypothetical protein LB505_007078 [Fusarium chuoi]